MKKEGEEDVTEIGMIDVIETGNVIGIATENGILVEDVNLLIVMNPDLTVKERKENAEVGIAIQNVTVTENVIRTTKKIETVIETVAIAVREARDLLDQEEEITTTGLRECK